MFIFNNNLRKQLCMKRLQADDGAGNGSSNTDEVTEGKNDIAKEILDEIIEKEKKLNDEKEVPEEEEELVDEEEEQIEDEVIDEDYSLEELKNMLIKDKVDKAFKEKGLTDKQILLVKKFSKEEEITGLVKNLKKDVDSKDVDALINPVKILFPELFEKKVVKKKTVGKGLNVSTKPTKKNDNTDDLLDKIIQKRFKGK